MIEAFRGKVQSEIRGIAEEQARYHIEAPFSGRFYLMLPDLQAIPGLQKMSDWLFLLILHSGRSKPICQNRS